MTDFAVRKGRILLVAVCLLASYYLGSNNALGDPLTDCKQCDCKIYKSWYTPGIDPKKARTAVDVGATYPFGASQEQQGLAPVYTWANASCGSQPLYQCLNVPLIDLWDYPSSYALCNLKQTQTLGIVTVDGSGTPVFYAGSKTHWCCN